MLKIIENQQLQSFNTLSIKARADFFVSISSVQDLTQLLQNEVYLNSKKLILGGGSNMLFLNDFKGIVIKNEFKFLEIINQNSRFVEVKVGSGFVWHDLVTWAVDNNFYGIENLSLIPGTVGAAPIQNIGAYGVEVKSVITKVEAFNLKSGKLKTFSNASMKFGYRDSVFKHHEKGKYFITNVYFKFKKVATLNTSYGAIEEVLKQKNISSPNLKDISQAVIEIRSSKLPNPIEIPNAGSFFKNPVVELKLASELKTNYPLIPTYEAEGGVKVAAGWLIEQCGWKGKSLGECGVHSKQALVLVNYGNASGADIVNLCKQIQKDVFDKFQIHLEPEVNFIS